MTDLSDLIVVSKPKRQRKGHTKASLERKRLEAEKQDSLALLRDSVAQMVSLEGTMSVIDNRSDKELGFAARKTWHDLWKSRIFLMERIKEAEERIRKKPGDTL